MQRSRRLPTFAAALVCALYIADLTGMGIVGPDEPRYAAVANAMSRSGDWITPRLWGSVWFEKPALLYWLEAAAFRTGLGPDLAPRLPVALLSVAFLAFFWVTVRNQWGTLTSLYSTGILATSAGWLAYSHVAITDVPLAVFFTSAVLLALPWIENGDRGGERSGDRRLPLAAASLGLAVLAKGLVPLVLFVPVLALNWRRMSAWFRPAPILAFAVCAAPWYAACAARNGREFLRVFFVQHQFERFTSGALQHVQPWWFYGPVALLLLYPWFPLLAYSGQADLKDRRIQTLAGIVIFGFAFFSASTNKLPSYLLPLIPMTAMLIGAGLARSRSARGGAIASAALLGLLPAAFRIVPDALVHGLHSADVPWRSVALGLIGFGLAGCLLAVVMRKNSIHAALVLAAAALLVFQVRVFPAIDQTASARPIWRASHPGCAPSLPRSLDYGLKYYAGGELPACGILDHTSAHGTVAKTTK